MAESENKYIHYGAAQYPHICGGDRDVCEPAEQGEVDLEAIFSNPSNINFVDLHRGQKKAGKTLRVVLTNGTDIQWSYNNPRQAENALAYFDGLLEAYAGEDVNTVLH